MITAHDVMPLLTEAWPELGPLFEAERSWWERDDQQDEGRPILHSITHIVVDEMLAGLERSETESFPALFEALERIITEGDMYATDFIGTGVMELLHDRLLVSRRSYQIFDQWWGPTGKWWWEAEVTISAAQVMSIMVTTIPGLWQRVGAQYEPMQRPGTFLSEYNLGLAASIVVEHITEMLRAGQSSELQGAFRVFELILHDGEPEAVAFVTSGVFEGLRRRLAGAGRDARDFEAGLGPLSRATWLGI